MVDITSLRTVRESEWVLVLPVASALLGYTYYVLFTYASDIGPQLRLAAIGTVGVSTVVIPAAAVAYEYDRVSVYLLGLLPSAGMGVGFAVELTGGRERLYADIVRSVLVHWGFAIPLVTVSFVVAAGWKHRDRLRERVRYLLVPVVISGLVTLSLALLWMFTHLLSIDAVS